MGTWPIFHGYGADLHDGQRGLSHDTPAVDCGRVGHVGHAAEERGVVVVEHAVEVQAYPHASTSAHAVARTVRYVSEPL